MIIIFYFVHELTKDKRIFANLQIILPEKQQTELSFGTPQICVGIGKFGKYDLPFVPTCVLSFPLTNVSRISPMALFDSYNNEASRKLLTPIR